MRVFLAMGQGDIVGDHKKTANGLASRGETSITFSEQAIRLLKARGHSGLLVSSHSRADRWSESNIETRHCPKPMTGRGGAIYHLSQLLSALQLGAMAKRFGAELAIIDSGTTHYFLLATFRHLGIPVAVNFHNVRWPHGFEPRGKVSKLIRYLDSRFFRTQAIAAMGCSPECQVQVQGDGAEALPYFPWTSQFSQAGFQPDRPVSQRATFNVLFVGRVERNKGVFDIVEMAKLIRDRSSLKVRFDVCGDGSALEPLRAAVEAADLNNEVRVRGRLERAELLAAYAAAHVTIVPTRGDFGEGMPLVCAEAMLAGRPVITSVLSNALPVIGPAIQEAQPESVVSFVDAIEAIGTSPERWRKLQTATSACRQQFLDRSLSYAAAIDRLLAYASGSATDDLNFHTLFGPTAAASREA